MASPLETALELAEEIRKVNTQEDNRIPYSDTFLKDMIAFFSRETAQIRQSLDILRVAKYIFIIKVVLPDMAHNARNQDPGVDAYIYADPKIVSDLRSYTEKKLEKAYEATYYKRKSPFQITRELFPKIKEHNNTPLGRYVNVVVMLEEYQRVLTASPNEYEDARRRNNLAALLEQSGTPTTVARDIPEYEIGPSIGSHGTKRAVDKIASDEVLINPKSPWSRLTSKFSSEFLIRIHLRKYEFDTVKKLILGGKIVEYDELKFVRDTLQVMESHVHLDPLLSNFISEMTELRRLAQKKMNILKGITNSGSIGSG
ncbi:hypothetical protein LEP1GSC050_2091 [Leptospira broomii serovar Hurstbridge str. 5399]|uniref:Uncharacterized protein n=1 Tax=Leptospira broomii serovar Hurstbridge str. 5399 TaxID=1049789 RepID=T0GAY5_9LEPT|nr:hypothetical protein [Leptospira broomii]EQA43994.1 hypothetical protein LEP1GSC050_2091 [Leptospira broomii serovar Hurstbridge str. 5399]